MTAFLEKLYSGEKPQPFSREHDNKIKEGAMSNEATVQMTGRSNPHDYEPRPWQIDTQVTYTFDRNRSDGEFSPLEAQRLLHAAQAKIRELIPPDVLHTTWIIRLLGNLSFKIPENEGGGRIDGSVLRSMADKYQVGVVFDNSRSILLPYNLDHEKGDGEFSPREARSFMESSRAFMGGIEPRYQDDHKLEEAHYRMPMAEGGEILGWKGLQERSRGVKPSSPMGASLQNPWCALGELGPDLDASRLQAQRLEHIARSALFGFELGPTTESFFMQVVPHVAQMQLETLFDTAPSPTMEAPHGRLKALTCEGVPHGGKYWFGCRPTPPNDVNALDDKDRKSIRIQGAMTAGDRPPPSRELFGRAQGSLELFHLKDPGGLAIFGIGPLYGFEAEGGIQTGSLAGWQVLNLVDALQRSLYLMAQEAAKGREREASVDVSADIMHKLRFFFPQTMAFLESFLGISLNAKWVNKHPDGRGAFLDVSLQIEVKRDVLRQKPEFRAFDKYWDDVGGLVAFEGALRDVALADGNQFRRVNRQGRNLVSFRFKTQKSEDSNPVLELKFQTRAGTLLPHKLKGSPQGQIQLGSSAETASGRPFSLRNRPPFFTGSEPRTLSLEFDQMFIEPDILPNLTVRNLIFELHTTGTEKGRGVIAELYTGGFHFRRKGSDRWEKQETPIITSPGAMARVTDVLIPGNIVDHARRLLHELRTAQAEVDYEGEKGRNRLKVKARATAPDNAFVTYAAKTLGKVLVPESDEAEVVLRLLRELFKAFSGDLKTQTAGLTCNPR